jgi:hypothetical protein
MKGETVTLKYNGSVIGKDDFNKDIHEPIEQEVSNVLIAPADNADYGNRGESNRPDAVEAKYRLMFPKLYVYGVDIEIFRGATIVVRGKEYKVVGKPGYFDDDNCPTDWCMVVLVGEVDG